MPIYEYRCRACGKTLEALQKFSAPMLQTCDSCGRDTMARQPSISSFHLKGNGWYQTDFKKDKVCKSNIK